MLQAEIVSAVGNVFSSLSWTQTSCVLVHSGIFWRGHGCSRYCSEVSGVVLGLFCCSVTTINFELTTASKPVDDPSDWVYTQVRLNGHDKELLAYRILFFLFIKDLLASFHMLRLFPLYNPIQAFCFNSHSLAILRYKIIRITLKIAVISSKLI